jgi:putative transposase
MKNRTDTHHRRSIRLKGYDYTEVGAYFVTICTQNRECLFGDIVDGEMRLGEAGRIVVDTWAALPQRFPSVEIDESVVMPNHFHGIILIAVEGAACRGAACCAPTLGETIRAFKSISAIAVNRLLGRGGRPLWQRNYYEHIVRDERSSNLIRQYIYDNPSQWAFDRENPEAKARKTREGWER